MAKVDHANYRNRTLADLCETAKIERVGPHMLRDTFALREGEVPADLLARLASSEERAKTIAEA